MWVEFLELQDCLRIIAGSNDKLRNISADPKYHWGANTHTHTHTHTHTLWTMPRLVIDCIIPFFFCRNMVGRYNSEEKKR